LNNIKATRYLVDAHVHFYDCFSISDVLDSAYANFQAIAKQDSMFTDFLGFLLLAETTKDHTYLELRKNAKQGKTIATKDGEKWHFSCFDDDDTAISAVRSTGQILIIFAGRQIITKEGLEVLALITTCSFKDGTPIREVIKFIGQCKGIAVVPWGAGKWLGQRGKLLKELIKSDLNTQFFLGDNGGRPNFWQKPAHFLQAEKMGMKILPGTDPLPLPSEGCRVGKFGFAIDKKNSSTQPGKDLKDRITDHNLQLLPYGQPERNFRFLYNQIKIRMRKFNKL
jgi:hypothetical protein